MAGKRACCPPVAASGGTPTTVDATFAHVRDQLRALHACVGLLVVEMNPQEVYAGMVDAAGILQDLTKDMLEAGLAKDEGIGDAQD